MIIFFYHYEERPERVKLNVETISHNTCGPRSQPSVMPKKVAVFEFTGVTWLVAGNRIGVGVAFVKDSSSRATLPVSAPRAEGTTGAAAAITAWRSAPVTH